MPHIPRRTPPLSGVPPELMPPPRAWAERDRKAAPPPPETPQAKRRKLGLPTINPHTYEPDLKQLVRSMLGKEPDVDPNTGQLVLHPGLAPAAPAGNVGAASPPVPVGLVFSRLADPHAHRPPPGFAGAPLRGAPLG